MGLWMIVGETGGGVRSSGCQGEQGERWWSTRHARTQGRLEEGTRIAKLIVCRCKTLAILRVDGEGNRFASLPQPSPCRCHSITKAWHRKTHTRSGTNDRRRTRRTKKRRN